MTKTSSVVSFVLKAIALAMAIASIVISYVDPALVTTTVIPLLGIGLLALTLSDIKSPKAG